MIKEFQGKYRWLSNFYPVEIQSGLTWFTSVENAYQAAKCKNFSDIKQFLSCSPGEAKKLGRKIKIREDWNVYKEKIMYDLLKEKFSQEPFRSKLLETGDEEIQEGNRWNDKVWGVDLRTGEGENRLGKLIMRVRDELRN